MREYWWILIGAVLCAVFSHKIDKIFEKFVKDGKKRAVWYCITGVISLAAIGFFVYMAWVENIGNKAMLIAFVPLGLFVIGVTAGILCGKARRRR